VGARGLLGTGIERRDQDFVVKKVIAHRHERIIRLSRDGFRIFRLLVKANDPPIGIDFDNAELGGLFDLDRERGDGDIGGFFLMLVDHLPDIHAIDVIRAENGDQFGIVPFEQIQILIHAVGGALVPIFSRAHLRRHRNDKMFAKKIGRAPPTVQVFQQGLRFELGHDINRQDAGVDEIRQHKIDDPVSPAKRNGGLGAVLRQWIKTLAPSACHDYAQHVHHKPLILFPA
jgi:hypothetical protein